MKALKKVKLEESKEFRKEIDKLKEEVEQLEKFKENIVEEQREENRIKKKLLKKEKQKALRQEKTNLNSSNLQQECEEIETDEQNNLTESGPDDLALTENILPDVSSTKLKFSC